MLIHPLWGQYVKNDEYIASLRCHVGENLRRLRLRQGLSQGALAERAQLNRSYLSMVENGRRNISLDNLVVLALALCVEPVELLRAPQLVQTPAEEAVQEVPTAVPTS